MDIYRTTSEKQTKRMVCSGRKKKTKEKKRFSRLFHGSDTSFIRAIVLPFTINPGRRCDEHELAMWIDHAIFTDEKTANNIVFFSSKTSSVLLIGCRLGFRAITRWIHVHKVYVFFYNALHVYFYNNVIQNNDSRIRICNDTINFFSLFFFYSILHFRDAAPRFGPCNTIRV